MDHDLAFSMDTATEAASDSGQGKADRLKVRLAHPQEGPILALLDTLASGDAEDVAGVAEQAKSLLQGDGIFVVHSTRKVGGDNAGDFYTYQGKPAVPMNQFSLWVRDPDGEAARNAAKGNSGMIYKSWRQNGRGPSFVRKFLDHCNALLRKRLGLDNDGNPVAQTAGDLPTGTAGPSDRSAETEMDEDLA